MSDTTTHAARAAAEERAKARPSEPDSIESTSPEAEQAKPKQRTKRERVKYIEVADDIRAQITGGHLHAGALLPSEPELMARYNVSRNTARNAIAALRAQGFVTVIHGRGAFVRRANDRPSHTHTRAVMRTPSAPGAGGTAGYADAETDDDDWWPVETPTTYRVKATPALALTLGVAEHAPLFAADQLLQDATGRRMLHRVYIPVTVAADVPALALDQEPPFAGTGRLYTQLAEHGHQLTWTEYVTARNPTPDDTNTLHVPDGAPILSTRRTTRDTNTQQVLILEETHRSADDTQLAYTLRGEPSAVHES